MFLFSAQVCFSQQTGADSTDTDSDVGLVGEEASNDELIRFGEKLREYILADNIEGLMSLMKHGVATPNGHYTTDETLDRLRDKSSWLRGRLFDGPLSAKRFFLRNPDSRVEVLGACQYVITYVSSDRKNEYECIFILVKGEGELQIWQLPACPL